MQKLDPKVVWAFFLRFFFSWLITFGFIFFGLANFLASAGIGLGYLWLLVLVFIVLIVFSWIWAKLSYHFWKYQLDEDAFKKEQGVIWKKYVSIPYERIQNVDIHRGIIARILGLSDLNIQTAGASATFHGRGRMSGIGAEGYLPCLDKNIAEQLREELVKRAKGKKQGL